MAKETIFQRLRDEAGGRELSVRWYRSKIQQIAPRLSPEKMVAEGKTTARVNYGMLNLFLYKPLWAAKLKYYDMFPLVLPLQSAPGGFLGCNFHYLAPGVRFRLLETLQRFANDNTFDSKTRLSVSYGAVKSIPFIKPTIKHYLWSYVRSSFLRIDMDEAPVSVYLPVQQFKKASAASVYAQSRKLY